MGDASLMAVTRFINQWVTEIVHPALARLILPDVFAVLHDKDKPYFQRTREAAFGLSLDKLAAQHDLFMKEFLGVLAPLRSTLSAQEYLAGAEPAYADHIAFSAFQWARVTSAQHLLDKADPISVWCERMLKAYGGLAGSAACAHPKPVPS